ncbi:response regulator transcription factor [Nocardia terpenica]|nr:response regulator transcription factor [Nocardia terpenica]MBF6061458.1 response regulator transcription factor [Nocardia terpenica]MBF6105313.1 response regulator transcription factor [Nocardia terpenica]MBF6113217.1 response regulator transcription factor [Nocardia terpenica]MBF6119347.1 response regulator transcription factor [Nocardia terpenica]MBF6152995.1 response regulator transcription factor [Nocardia terpenica]
MIKVVLLDDEAIVRGGIAMILAAGPGIEVVAQDGDGRAVVDLIARHHPDVVVTDIRMPYVDGLEVTRRVRALPDPPAVLVLTTFGLDEYVYAALESGAAGFLLKDAPPAELARAVEVVAAGDAILAPAVTKRLLDTFATGGAKRAQARDQLDELTEREREVAMAVATGASNADIARRLHMSEATVKVHVSRTISKLGLDNRTQVAILAHQAGLI